MIDFLVVFLDEKLMQNSVFINENDAKANDKVVVFTTCPYIKWGNIHAPGSVTNATLKHNDSNKTSGDYYA
ncbi:hypothetical protein BGC84_000194 [Escherichia coli]|nr:hypothetical protein [Escherichia coli]EFL7143605.1 hypothetical protein [Escherichia coli]